MKRWIVAGLTGLLSVPVLACPLTERLAQRYGITFSGFEHAIPETAAPATGDGASFVRIVFQEVPYVADGFRHTVVMDKSTGKAWILRTGGFVGVHQWYGPVDAGDASPVSLAQCRLEPVIRAAAQQKGDQRSPRA